jgi:peptidoglycan hydrolase-like protein with peptidoglycan-binding domain
VHVTERQGASVPSVKPTIARIAAPLLGGVILATSLAASPASASTTAPYIREGSSGIGVLCVQIALNFFDNAGLTVDGIDGPATTRAVKNFQAEEHVAVDGIVGPITGQSIWNIDNQIHAQYCYSYVPTEF